MLYADKTSSCDECSYQPYMDGTSVKYLGYSSYDAHMYQPYRNNYSGSSLCDDCTCMEVRISFQIYIIVNMHIKYIPICFSSIFCECNIRTYH